MSRRPGNLVHEAMINQEEIHGKQLLEVLPPFMDSAFERAVRTELMTMIQVWLAALLRIYKMCPPMSLMSNLSFSYILPSVCARAQASYSNWAVRRNICSRGKLYVTCQTGYANSRFI